MQPFSNVICKDLLPREAASSCSPRSRRRSSKLLAHAGMQSLPPSLPYSGPRVHVAMVVTIGVENPANAILGRQGL